MKKYQDIKLYLQYESNYFGKCTERRLEGTGLEHWWRLPVGSAGKGDLGLPFHAFLYRPLHPGGPLPPAARAEPGLFSLFLLFAMEVINPNLHEYSLSAVTVPGTLPVLSHLILTAVL